MLTLFALTCGASTAAAQCGQDYHATPAHSDVRDGPPLAVGDSVLADAVPLLVRDGFEADGMVCRQMGQGLALLRARGSNLPHLVVLALGTNGEVTPQDIDTALTIVGPERILALVTPHGSVVPASTEIIRAAAASHPGRIVLLDWDRLVDGHANWLAPDGVHLGGSAGIAAFAHMIASLLPYATPASAEAEAPTEPGTPITIQPPAGHQNQPTNDQQAAPRVRSQSATSRSPLVALGALLAAIVTAAAVPW